MRLIILNIKKEKKESLQVGANKVIANYKFHQKMFEKSIG